MAHSTSIYRACLLASLLWATGSTAQTITFADFAATVQPGTVVMASESARIELDIGTPGSGNQWVFSYLPALSTQTSILAPAATPFAAEFSGATHVTYGEVADTDFQGEAWVYQALRDTRLSQLGSASNVPGLEGKLVYSPALVVLEFPLELGRAVSSSALATTTTTLGTTTITLADSVHAESVVDATGQLILPDGISRPAVRVRSTRVFRSLSGTTVMEDISFLTSDGYGVSLEEPDSTGVTEGRVTGDVRWAHSGGGTNVHQAHEAASEGIPWGVYPNPVRTNTTLWLDMPSAESARIELTDILGRRLATVFDGVLAPGPHEWSIDASGYPPGVYIWTVRAGAWSASRLMHRSR
ncbi:MAG: T9SS type A sorting domain-containing protein [Rhodothermales bacterium]|nr:T9SS type A sorting domain-containing protein [Rhodothermales bacterium]MBO6778063.1 T9SS type A sorting domain-containing protein [Rhodothermales bacterium]